MSAEKGVRLHAEADPSCPRCHGAGDLRKVYTEAELRAMPPYMIPSTHFETCGCVRVRREREALERVWRGFSGVEPVDKSPLLKYAQSDAWVRASSPSIRAHLYRVLRQVPALVRATRVVSDLDLVSAWLATAGLDILDPEVAVQQRDAEDAYLRLVDLVAPPALLVLRLGVKAARNVAVPEVILEALQCRAHRGRPTWIVEDPYLPFRSGALFWSPQLVAHTAQWDRVEIDGVHSTQECVETLSYLGPHESPLIRPSEPAASLGDRSERRPAERPERAPSTDPTTLPNGLSIDKKEKRPKRAFGAGRGKPSSERRIREADEA